MKPILACLISLAMAGGAVAAERPADPGQAMPDPPARSACAHRSSRDALLAEASLRINGAFDAGIIRTNYARDLAAWKLGLLVERGLAASAADGLRARLQDEASASSIGQDEDLANAEFVAATEAFDDARSLGRARQACEALVGVLTAIGHVVAATEARWAFVGARYDDLARQAPEQAL